MSISSHTMNKAFNNLLMRKEATKPKGISRVSNQILIQANKLKLLTKLLFSQNRDLNRVDQLVKKLTKKHKNRKFNYRIRRKPNEEYLYHRHLY